MSEIKVATLYSRGYTRELSKFGSESTHFHVFFSHENTIICRRNRLLNIIFEEISWNGIFANFLEAAKVKGRQYFFFENMKKVASYPTVIPYMPQIQI